MTTYKQALKDHLVSLVDYIDDECENSVFDDAMSDFYVEFESLTPEGCKDALINIINTLKGKVDIVEILEDMNQG